MDGDRSQNPAYRATLLQHKWAGAKSPLTFPYIACTSFYTTCRRFRSFYGETMGKYGQSYGQSYGRFARWAISRLKTIWLPTSQARRTQLKADLWRVTEIRIASFAGILILIAKVIETLSTPSLLISIIEIAALVMAASTSQPCTYLVRRGSWGCLSSQSNR